MILRGAPPPHAPGRASAAAVALAALAAGCGRLGYDPNALAGAADAAPAPDYCSVLPALASAPVLDGKLEPGLTLRPLVPVAWLGIGSGPPAGQSAQYAAAWRPDGLYVYVEVVDPDRVPAPPTQFRWCGDSVEVYADDDGSYTSPPRYDDPGTRQIIVAAPADATTSVHGGEAWCSPCGDTTPTQLPGSALISTPRADGYAVEALVVAADLARPSWSLAAGDRVGFDLAVNVSTSAPTGDACTADGIARGSELGQYFLRADAGANAYPFDTTDPFCAPRLLAP